jgi:hypothetical protein
VENREVVLVVVLVVVFVVVVTMMRVEKTDDGGRDFFLWPWSSHGEGEKRNVWKTPPLSLTSTMTLWRFGSPQIPQMPQLS